MSSKKEKQKKALGIKLLTLRNAWGLSQRALAALAGIDHSQILRIEKGEISPSIITIQNLAEALEVSPCDFFDC